MDKSIRIPELPVTLIELQKLWECLVSRLEENDLLKVQGLEGKKFLLGLEVLNSDKKLNSESSNDDFSLESVEIHDKENQHVVESESVPDESYFTANTQFLLQIEKVAMTTGVVIAKNIDPFSNCSGSRGRYHFQTPQLKVYAIWIQEMGGECRVTIGDSSENPPNIISVEQVNMINPIYLCDKCLGLLKV